MFTRVEIEIVAVLITAFKDYTSQPGINKDLAQCLLPSRTVIRRV